MTTASYNKSIIQKPYHLMHNPVILVNDVELLNSNPAAVPRTASGPWWLWFRSLWHQSSQRSTVGSLRSARSWAPQLPCIYLLVQRSFGGCRLPVLKPRAGPPHKMGARSHHSARSKEGLQIVRKLGSTSISGVHGDVHGTGWHLKLQDTNACSNLARSLS